MYWVNSLYSVAFKLRMTELKKFVSRPNSKESYCCVTKFKSLKFILKYRPIHKSFRIPGKGKLSNFVSQNVEYISDIIET